MHNRRLFVLLGLAALIASLWLNAIGVARAQIALTATPTSSPIASTNVESTPEATPISANDIQSGNVAFSFQELSVPSFDLHTPIDIAEYRFQLPYRWILGASEQPAYLGLHYSMQYATGGVTPETFDPSLLPSLRIFVNDQLISVFVPAPGLDQTVRVEIPADILHNATNNEFALRFEHYRNGECSTAVDSFVTIHSDSSFTFDFVWQSPVLDLATFPHPLVTDSFLPEKLLFIIPDDFNESELEALTIINSAIGAVSNSNVIVEVLSASQAIPEIMRTANIVIIGSPKRNAFLTQLYETTRLPTTLTNDGSTIVGPNGRPLEASAGVLQMIQSDTDGRFMYLAVTGVTDQAVLLAAQALGAAGPRYGLRGNVAVITGVLDEPITEADRDTFTLADLGLSDTTIYGIRSQRRSVSFFVPWNWNVGPDARVVVSYIHSDRLDPDTSGLTVELNGKPIGSVPIDTAQQGEKKVSISIPVDDILVGQNNRLSFNIISQAFSNCASFQSRSIWMRLRSTSLLYLPHNVKTDVQNVQYLDPISYLFTTAETKPIWFSLPPQPTADELRGLAQLSLIIGNQRHIPLSSPRVTFQTLPDPKGYESYHVVAIGQPDTNPMISLVNDALPQPFVLGQTALRQGVGNITYQLPQGFSLGIIEVAPSPWNPESGVTVITGITTEGLTWALDTITNRDLLDQIDRDIVFVHGNTIEAIRSADLTNATIPEIIASLPGGVAPVESTPTPTPAPVAIVDASNIPEEYLPRTEPLSEKSRLLVLGLIGAGMLLGSGGLVVSLIRVNRERRRRTPRA